MKRTHVIGLSVIALLLLAPFAIAKHDDIGDTVEKQLKKFKSLFETKEDHAVDVAALQAQINELNTRVDTLEATPGTGGEPSESPPPTEDAPPTSEES
jgi:peptidoglycan hydrolase CwlO-like protein